MIPTEILFHISALTCVAAVNEPKPASSEAFQYDHDRFEDLWDDCELSDDGSWETVKKKKPRQDSGADKTTVQDQVPSPPNVNI